MYLYFAIKKLRVKLFVFVFVTVFGNPFASKKKSKILKYQMGYHPKS